MRLFGRLLQVYTSDLTLRIKALTQDLKRILEMKRRCDVTLLNKIILCAGSSKQRGTVNLALLQKIFETQKFIMMMLFS